MFKLGTAIAFLALLALSPAHSESAKPFITHKDLDISVLLPPPPADDSAQTKAELGEILTLQVTRTPEQAARAAADAEEEIWRFADVMGAKFKKEALPKTAAFYERVGETEDAVVDPVKAIFKRTRPHLLSPLVQPAAKLSKSGSWPSGHATRGTMMGLLLSQMVPEKRAEIMARAWEYGANRILGGLHYRSDVEVGRMSGAVIANELMKRDEFKAEFAAAKAELRAALGL